ncbi:TonB-dependent receptor [Alteromonas sp. 1_MG-2023]|uniref:TonB-dependent receptor n=1 Tax=Alteromonas sp. 1_MG-2023 TaxID=3062669 RepID=UPI0026E1A686|nr:TonB-dependent receptor [Alteromonas sp. 1_MG-2023]MDO6568042.1 TonB-dependent receptor [Alteromonas sp. 1_MG-2023]
MRTHKLASLALAVSAAFSTSIVAQEAETTQKKETALEQITVTAQKRTQSIQEVPISVATLSGEKFESLFSGGEDILALAVRVPGLYAESSNGRVAPRFYIRGLGNTDFDLAASQPVSIIMDEVVMENVVLKSFPLFDVQQVEVLRGPQGTLFGRNTTAGIIKFDTVKPTQDLEGYAKAGFGSYGTMNFEGAISGGLTDELSARLSLLSQERDDYIDNAFTGENDAIGGFDEKAYRLQLLWEPSDDFSALLNVHGRDLEGTASIFRGNVFNQGENGLNASYDRDTVSYDSDLLGTGADNNPQEYDGFGTSLKLEYDMDNVTFTSISAMETAEGYSLGDVDGDSIASQNFVTQDKLNDLEQYTQEFRLSSNTTDAMNWQVGAFYYDASFNVTSVDGFYGATTVFHENQTWAVFGQTSYQVNEKLNLTGGLRYTHDDKSLIVGDQNVNGFAVDIGFASVQEYDDINVGDGQMSYELSANYRITDDMSAYARYSNGFRAQSIQARDVAFESAPSVADAETINSYEVGFKSDLLDGTLRFNGAMFYYSVDDMQLTAIGGDNNLTALVNADEGEAYGFEIDSQWLATDELTLTAGYSYNHTEIKDDTLTISGCAACTVTDPVSDDGNYIVNGNSFPQAPESIFNFTARYTVPMGDNGEFFVFTDWAFQGETNIFLYESVEFTTDDNFEGGLRIGYENFEHNYTVALFGRNITDEDNIKGAIDFANLTGIVNEPRILGVEVKYSFY